jgi:hypothetical protein
MPISTSSSSSCVKRPPPSSAATRDATSSSCDTPRTSPSWIPWEETIRESVTTEERIAENEAFFKSGEATLEVIETYASGNLAVLVAVERQHGEIGELPPQDWSLRATIVFRREGSAWRLVHRHADALVHPITFEQLSKLARGEGLPST